MRAIQAGLVVFLAFAFVGCQTATDPNPYAKHNLGSSGDVIRAGIEDMGGLAKWEQVKSVTATAVVSYWQDGQGWTERMYLDMDFWGGTITALGELPNGHWTATVSDDGKCVVSGRESQAPLCSALRTLLHRVRGPLNLVGGREKSLGVSSGRIEGQDLKRLAVLDAAKQPMAYYFDYNTNMLRYLTTGNEIPGKEGTVTRYAPGKEGHQKLPNGLVLPNKFEIVKVGQHVLVGEQPVMRVELSEIETH